MRVSPPVHRLVARPVGMVVLVAAACMALTAAASIAFSLIDGTDRVLESVPLLIAAPISAGIGLVARHWGRQTSREHQLSRAEASVAVTAIWTLLGVVGGLPLILGAGTHPVDALFEAVSGFTTTGATIYGDIEHTLSRPLVLWRGVMHWLGGMGIVVLFVAIFPNIGVSGKNMFKSEVPAVSSEGLRPRITETSMVLWRLYLGLTIAAVGTYWALGMGLHDALVHAFATLSTGGFSSRDASIGAFQSPGIDVAASVFMLIAGVNFGLYYALLKSRKLSVFARSAELRFYVGIVLGFTVALTIALLPLHDGRFLVALRFAFFRVATALTSTGFGIDDHAAYPPLAMALLLAMMFVGGSTGSTAGGIKVGRLVILLQATATQIRRSLSPSVIRVVRVDGRPVEDGIVLEVATFFFAYLTCLGIGVLAVVLADGVPVQTAFGAVLSAISNMGPAPFYLTVDNYAGWSVFSKLVFVAEMILGRLELFTVLAILLPEVWKR